MKRLITRNFLFFVVMLLLSAMAYAQTATTTAGISGDITDTKGNPLPSAVVLAKHLPTGTQFGTSTRVDGKYNLPGLKVGGPYEVSVSYVGFQTVKRRIEYLQLGQNFSLDVQLSESAVQLQNVVVTAQQNSVIHEDRTGAAQYVDTKQMEEIPTINRSFQSFAKLSPLFSGTGLNAAGRNNKYNNIQIDGTQYNDLFGLGSTGTPGGQTGTNPISLDAIQEFQVVIAPFDVRLGGFTGGGINAITRSGTNDIKASVFGYGRNQSMVGKYLNNASAPVKDFKQYQYGARVGGAIIPDKLFYFVSGEITANNTPLSNISLTSGGAALQAQADTVAMILKSRGLDPGSSGQFTPKQPSGKFFVRFDYNISQEHKLTIHDNYVDASQDILGSRTSATGLSFDSYTYRISDKTNNLVAQLNSTFSNVASNELIAGYTTIRDNRGPIGGLTPEIQIRGGLGGVTYEAGTDQYSSANKLNQDVFEFTDNFTYFMGAHTFTVGTHNEFYKFYNLFLRAYGGYWQYNSWNDFKNGVVGSYARVISRVSNPMPAAEFHVRQFGFYAQDEYQALPNLKVTAGVRVEIPTLPDQPYRNDSLAKYFPGLSTTDVPSGNPLWSPRLGFNLDLNNDRDIQIRGGLGIFSGRPAYVWISNQYGNTGVTQMQIGLSSAAGSGALLQKSFSADPTNQPGLTTPGIQAGALTSEIDLSDPKLKLPQILRYDLGVDKQLPLGFVATVEFQYSKSINEMMYKKLNIINHDTPGTLAQDGRPLYGGTDSKNKNFLDVLYLTNTNKGYQYNLVFQVQRNVSNGFSTNFGYVYGTAKDVNGILSSQALSQMRYNPISGDPNDPELTTSDFDIRHRIFASVAYTEEFIQNAPTTISLFYNGQSGQPYSFTVQGDINGDGFDGNDLFYIPKNDADILLGSLSSGAYVANSAYYTQLDNFIAKNSYLNGHRGTIARRNGDRAPWNSYLDFHLAQEFPVVPGHKFTLTFDILNVLNLLKQNWGWVNLVPNNSYNIVKLVGKATTGAYTGQYVYQPITTSLTPWALSQTSSRWQMQIGLRYSL
jgi:hypothetical protein